MLSYLNMSICNTKSILEPNVGLLEVPPGFQASDFGCYRNRGMNVGCASTNNRKPPGIQVGGASAAPRIEVTIFGGAKNRRRNHKLTIAPFLITVV